MSTTTAATTTATAPKPYLCDQCNRIVSRTPPPPQKCPLCNTDDSLHEHHFVPQPLSLLPESPSTSSANPSFSLLDNDGDDDDFIPHGPASNRAGEALPTVEITCQLIDCSDSGVQCVVCLSDFEIGSEAKQMPCNHIFHWYCILRWLESHNTCPVCRFELPTDDPDSDSDFEY